MNYVRKNLYIKNDQLERLNNLSNALQIEFEKLCKEQPTTHITYLRKLAVKNCGGTILKNAYANNCVVFGSNAGYDTVYCVR